MVIAQTVFRLADNRSGQTSAPFSIVATWLRAGFWLTFAFSDHLCVKLNMVANVAADCVDICGEIKLAKDSGSCQL